MYKVYDYYNDFFAYTNDLEQVNELKQWLVEVFGEGGDEGICVEEITEPVDTLISQYKHYAESEGML